MSFAEKYGPWALILGASEGMGAAFAEGAARRGCKVLLVARRPDALEERAQAIRSAHGVEVRTAAADVGQPGFEAELARMTEGLDLGLVVYNAAYSAIGEFVGLPLEDKLRTVDVNVRGLVITTHHFGARMAERGRGGIVILSSMSGFQGSAMVGIYAATKAFDTVLGETLWEELGERGVDVLVCAAGATLTPNFLGQTPKDKRSMAMPMEPGAVAEGALDALGRSGPTWIPGRVNRLVHRIFSLLPKRRSVRIISNTTRKMYRGEP